MTLRPDANSAEQDARGDRAAAAGDSSPFRSGEAVFPVTRPDYTHSAARRSERRRSRKDLALGIAFLSPNILGFLCFTAVPLVFAMVLAFTNWDLKLHNRYRAKELIDEGLAAPSIHFVGFDNFARLLNWHTNPDFYKFLGNTLFMMMGMPFGIAASLIAAMMLSKDLRGGGGRIWISLITSAALVASVLLLTSAGLGAGGMTFLLVGLIGAVAVAGTIGGTGVYRTLFYVPNFTAGVATYLLWKKLYNPTSGPINMALHAPLRLLSDLVSSTPAPLWHAMLWVGIVVVIALMFWGANRLRKTWIDGDVGTFAAMLAGTLCVVIPAIACSQWYAIGPGGTRAYPSAAILLFLGAIAAAGGAIARAMTSDRSFVTRKPWQGVGGAVMIGAMLMVAELVIIGLSAVAYQLPEWAGVGGGLAPPKWLDSPSWAKPSLMLMGFWGAIGSTTMLLYLAALTNVPGELYEAADIDGATRLQKFWNVTWPQLAPTTFFTVVMGVIGGLQGGFEVAKVMTGGGPASQTKTLAFFIYTEGFETGRLGYSSAIAWVMFLMVLVVTAFNWKFGNKYVE